MARTLEELEVIVRERICRVCSDRTVDGGCGLEDPASCALFRLFPQVARAVQSTSSDDIRDYIRAIREQVCSVCYDLPNQMMRARNHYLGRLLARSNGLRNESNARKEERKARRALPA